MSSPVYIDTSALAKRYLRESGSDEFDAFLGRMASASISRLTTLELQCTLARRRRNHDIDASAERRAWAAFDEDVAQGFFEVHPLEDRHAISARELMNRLGKVPLRTLDALHLAIATGIEAKAIATADEVLGEAGAIIGLRIDWFGEGGRARRTRR